MRGAWEGAEDTGWPAAEDCTFACGDGGGGICSYLFMVLAVDEKTGYKGTKDLREDIVGDFLPGKSLPGSKTYRYGGIEVTLCMLADGS